MRLAFKNNISFVIWRREPLPLVDHRDSSSGHGRTLRCDAYSPPFPVTPFDYTFLTWTLFEPSLYNGYFYPSITSNLDTLASDQLRRYLIQTTSPRPRLPRSQRRQRTTFTHEQTLRLEMEYHVSEYISRSKRFQLAELLDLTENQIKIWFQNRRAKDKRIEKAICEQQYRYMPSLTSISSTLSNCTTCHYTKQQFSTPISLPRDQKDHQN